MALRRGKEIECWRKWTEKLRVEREGREKREREKRGRESNGGKAVRSRRRRVV